MKDLRDLRCGNGIFSLPSDDPMTPACSAHDLDYIEGGSAEDKAAAEENFRKNCDFIAAKRGGVRCWIESKVLPPLASFLGKYFWRPFSRRDDYIAQGREKGQR